MVSRNDALPPLPVDLGDHVFGSLFVAPDYQYVSAAGGQGDGRSLADPARRARYQSCLAF